MGRRPKGAKAVSFRLVIKPGWAHRWQIGDTGEFELISDLDLGGPPGQLYVDCTETDTATLLARMGETILSGITPGTRWLNDAQKVASISGRLNVRRTGSGFAYDRPDGFWQWAALSAHVAAHLKALEGVLDHGAEDAIQQCAERKVDFNARFPAGHPIRRALPGFPANPWEPLARAKHHGEPVSNKSRYREIQEVSATVQLEARLGSSRMVSAVKPRFISTAATHALLWLTIWWSEATEVRTCGGITDATKASHGCRKPFIPQRADQRYCLTDEISSRCRQKQR